MKVVDVKTFVVGNPPPRFGGRYFIFVKLTTDTGITGIGEVDIALDPPAEIVHGMLLVTRAGSLVEAYTATRDTVTLSTSLAPGEVAVVRYQSRSA